MQEEGTRAAKVTSRKAQDAGAVVADKAQDAGSYVADKAQDVGGKALDKASRCGRQRQGLLCAEGQAAWRCCGPTRLER